MLGLSIWIGGAIAAAVLSLRALASGQDRALAIAAALIAAAETAFALHQLGGSIFG